VTAVNTIGDGSQHICRAGLFILFAMIYSEMLKTG
jgi:hypothetical protein